VGGIYKQQKVLPASTPLELRFTPTCRYIPKGNWLTNAFMDSEQIKTPHTIYFVYSTL